MRIAINASDLDHSRIDGTRIYIQNLLKNFGLLDSEDQFLIYHKSEFNPQLAFPQFENYKIRKLEFPFWWTQARFAWEICREQPDVLWMPMHSLPYFRPRKTKSVVTIHDLAFKIFPQFFPRNDLRRINLLTDYAVRHADKLIAVSESTKKDILKFYPTAQSEKIKVIYHGCDKNMFHPDLEEKEISRVRKKYGIPDGRYIISAGSIQIRKNLETLLEAFSDLKKLQEFQDVNLVIAGQKGWMFESTMERVEKQKKVFYVGAYEPEDLPLLLGGAEIFVMPSLYEGFGLPVLEAMATGIPVIAAENSSLAEIVGESGKLFESQNSTQLSGILQEMLKNGIMIKEYKEKGLKRAGHFSWEKCTRETLEWLGSDI